MALSSPSRPGQNLATGDASANLLKVFAGEVLATFEQVNVMMGLTRVKSVGGGAVGWQFPIIGTSSTSYHTPGENVLTEGSHLKTISNTLRWIYADKNLISTIFIDKLDQLLNHWDTRGEYARELGRALAITVDKNLIGALHQATIDTDGNFGVASTGGFKVVDADAATNGVSFVDSLFRAKQALDERNVPESDRYAIMSPAQMRLLFTDGAGALSGSLQWVSRDFTNGQSTLNEGRIPRLAGFDLYVTNHIPTVDYNVASQPNQFAAAAANTYQVDITPGTDDIYAYVFQKEAVGTVKIADLMVESEYKIEYQGDVLVGKMSLGHGILRPECAGRIAKA